VATDNGDGRPAILLRGRYGFGGLKPNGRRAELIPLNARPASHQNFTYECIRSRLGPLRR